MEQAYTEQYLNMQNDVEYKNWVTLALANKTKIHQNITTKI